MKASPSNTKLSTLAVASRVGRTLGLSFSHVAAYFRSLWVEITSPHNQIRAGPKEVERPNLALA